MRSLGGTVAAGRGAGAVGAAESGEARGRGQLGEWHAAVAGGAGVTPEP